MRVPTDHYRDPWPLRHHTARAVVGLLLSMLLAGCGGGGATDSVTPPPLPLPPEPVTPTVSLSSPSLAFSGLGSTGPLSATVSPATATVAWTSSNPAVATITGNGSNIVVTAVAGGSAQITATATNTNAGGTRTASASATVTVTPIVRQIVVTPAVDSALTGQQRTFVATVTADAGLANTVTWRSSAPSVASIDAAGRATAVGAGSTIITAVSTSDSTVRSTATLTVRTPVVRSVQFTLPATLGLGRSATAVPTVTAESGADTRLTWSSSVPAVATVDTGGRVVAISPGTTTITVRAAAFALVSSNAVLTVTAPPTTSVFSELAAGSRVAVTNARITDIFATSSTEGMIFADGSAPNIGGIEAPIQLGSNAWRLRDDLMTGYYGRYGAGAAGSSASDIFWALRGEMANSSPSASFVLRWNGTTLSNTNWPLPTGNGSPHARALASVGVAEALAVASDGAVRRYRAGAWSSLAPASAATRGTGMSAWNADSAVITRCRDGSTDSRIGILRAGTVTLLPNTTLGDDTPNCARSPIALANGEFYVALDRVVARYGSGGYTAFSPTLPQGEWFYELVLCGNTLYAGTSGGRVFRASGTQLSEIGTSESATVGEVSAMQCAPDGSLRVGSGVGLVTRWSGGSWTDEHFGAALGSVSLQSVENGLAVGSAGTVWRWDGTRWTILRRQNRDGLSAVYLAPDGRRFAGGTSTRGGSFSGLLLSHDGTSWVSDFSSAGSAVSALWGTSSSNVFATTSGSGNSGRILRFDGNSWSTVLTSNASLYAVHGIAPALAIAVGTGGVVHQWNGSNWSAFPSVPVPTPTTSLTTVQVFSATSIYAGAGLNGCDSFSSGGLWRWNGTAWVDAGLGAAGFSTCVTSVFGTGPNDVFALIRRPFTNGALPPNQLVRWNGTTWSLVNTALVAQSSRGAAVPGLTMMTGGLSRVVVGTAPAALRLSR